MKSKRYQVFLKAFGNHLRITRKNLGFSQEKLAYESEIELRQLGRIERGEINTDIGSLKIIAETLAIHVKELMNFNYPHPLYLYKTSSYFFCNQYII